jgi:hypothetical protein
MKELIMSVIHEETRNYDVQWRCLDEELVEEFGRWLTRMGKVFAISLSPILAATFMGWL